MKHLPRLISILIVIIVYAFAVPSDISNVEKRELAKDFKFDRNILYYPKNLKQKFVRNVHPQYEEISTWISSVGAAISFTDYDGDGLYNDLVHVDPRFNKIFISPAPNTGDRFKPFELKVKQLPFNDKTIAPTGVLTNDFNEDGKTDILVFYLGRSPIIFYQKSSGFKEVELVENQRWNSTTATLADLNGDGHTDIFIGNYFPDESKLLYAEAKDNKQIMQHSMSKGDNGAKNRIFLWKGIENGVAIYKEEKEWLNGMKIPFDWTLAVGAADINNDLLPEIYISNDFGPDRFLLNTTKNGQLSFKELTGQRKFTTIRSNIIGTDSFKGMGVDFGDINNDGNLDIYVSNIAADYALHESHFVFVHNGKNELLQDGIAPYINQSEKLGLSRSSWGWESKLTDFNNDGIKEAIQATGFVKGKIDRWPQLQELATTNDELLKNVDFWPHLRPGDDLCGDAHIPLFVRSKSGKYFDLSPQIGLAENQITRGIAISDVEHDGKLDFVVAAQWEDSKLYRNKSNTKNEFLGLQLLYPTDTIINTVEINTQHVKTRPAIGAVARLKLNKKETLIAFVDGGNGHSGKNSKEIHFGLGEQKKNNTYNVEISWIKSNGIKEVKTINIKSGWHKILLPFNN